MESAFEVQGVRVPALIYGTAWKEDATTPLTRAALAAGFRGIDTANQRRHYHEAAVGQAVAEVLSGGQMRRQDLFIQTKFTYKEGQDDRLPFDPRAPVADQVRQSFRISLEHLQVDRIDAYLLHGPSQREGLEVADWDAWRAMEELQRVGGTRLIGVSNVTAGQLSELWESASVKPAVVQNRCFTRPAADRDVRAFCRERGIVYEGFSLLTARQSPVNSAVVREIATRKGATSAQAVFRWAMASNMAVLTGTTSELHMRQDLEAQGLDLSGAEAQAISGLVE